MLAATPGAPGSQTRVLTPGMFPPTPSFFRTSRKTTPRQGVTEVPPTSGTQAVLPKFLSVHAFNPKRGKSEAGAGPSAGFSGAGVGRSSAYNGPSVSLCFYSQIGSAGLKANGDGRSASAAALAAPGPRVPGEAAARTPSRRGSSPSWLGELPGACLRWENYTRTQGKKKKGEIPPNAEHRL